MGWSGPGKQGQLLAAGAPGGSLIAEYCVFQLLLGVKRKKSEKDTGSREERKGEDPGAVRRAKEKKSSLQTNR